MSTRKRKPVPFSELPFDEQMARAERLARDYRYRYSLDPEEWPFPDGPKSFHPFDRLVTTPYTLELEDVTTREEVDAAFRRSLDYAQAAYVYGICVGMLHRR